MFKRLIASLVCLTFSFSNLQYVHAQDFSINQLPVPGTMVGESVPFAPLTLKGLVVNLQKPLEFQFIVDTGKGPQDTSSVKDQTNQLVKYFLAGLTIPEGDLWVNLSPYEKNRMVPPALGQTDLGRDLLAQDYILKQLTASLIYPEKDLGKEFWSRVYAKAQQQFGTTNVPVNTFNKVWILPNEAQVFENNNAAYVTKSTLKVMLDEDYLALQKHMPVRNGTDSIGANIVREIVLPEIEKEVNTGKNFAPLRQIYQALILAKWYKETIQNGLLDALYTNKNRVAGVNLNDPNVKEQIYNRYLQAYKKGVFNYIKEDPTPDGQVVPRKYFSGGTNFEYIPLALGHNFMDVMSHHGTILAITIGLVAVGIAGLTYYLWKKKAVDPLIEDLKREALPFHPFLSFHYEKYKIYLSTTQSSESSLVKIGVPAIPALAKATNSEYLWTRLKAPILLGMIWQNTKSKAALRALVNALKYNDATYSAAQVLYAIDAREAVPLLKELMSQNKELKIQNIIDHFESNKINQSPKLAATIVDDFDVSRVKDLFKRSRELMLAPGDFTVERAISMLNSGNLQNRLTGLIGLDIFVRTKLKPALPDNIRDKIYDLILSSTSFTELSFAIPILKIVGDPRAAALIGPFGRIFLQITGDRQSQIANVYSELSEIVEQIKRNTEGQDLAMSHAPNKDAAMRRQSVDSQELPDFKQFIQQNEMLTDYSYDDRLGRDLDVLVVVKDNNLVGRHPVFKAEVLGNRESRNYHQGHVFETTLNQDSIMINQHSNLENFMEPTGADFFGDLTAVTNGDSIIVFDNRTQSRRVIHNKKFSHLHDIVFSDDGKRLLVASTGFEKLLEIDLETGHVLWEWTGWEHGFNQSKSGRMIVGGQDEFLKLVSDGKDPFLVDNLGAIGGYGIPNAFRALHVNGAIYGPKGTILATFFNRGEVVSIDKVTGNAKVIYSGLNGPHGFYKDPGVGYMLTDTRHGKFFSFDVKNKLARILNLAGMPGTLKDRESFGEWLQFVTKLTPDIYAVVDERRSAVYLVNMKNRSYRTIKTEENFAIQYVKVNPSKKIVPIVARNYQGQQVPLSGTGDLYEAMQKLVEQQVKVGVSIPFSRTGDLAAYFDKIDRGIFKVQVNPRRHPDNRVVIKSGKQGGDFLDPKNMPDEEAGFPVPGHDQYDVYPNPSPYEMNHIVLVGRGNETGTYPSQSLDTPEKIDAGFDFLRMVNQPDYNMTFNSTGAAKSSPHFHWQGFQVDLPIEHLPVGDVKTDAEGIKTGFVQNYPAQVIYLEGKDKDALVNKVLKITQRLTQGSEGKPIPYNVLLKMTSDKTYKVFIFPRNFETPSEGKEGLISSKFGILEMSGAVITYTADPRTAEGLFINSEKNQVKLTEDLIKESLQYASFQNRDFLKGIIDSAMSRTQKPASDAAMFTVLRIRIMSDVDELAVYLNNKNSDIRQAAMNRVDKLAINSKLNEDVYIEAAKSRYIEVTSWAVQNLQKSSYPTPIIAKIIKEYRQVEDLIKLLDSSSPVLRLNVARTLYEIKPSYLYVEHYPAHSEPELEYIDGFSWNGNTGYYPTGRTIEIPESFVIINGFKRWDINADKAMSNPQAKPQTQDAAMLGLLYKLYPTSKLFDLLQKHDYLSSVEGAWSIMQGSGLKEYLDAFEYNKISNELYRRNIHPGGDYEYVEVGAHGNFIPLNDDILLSNRRGSRFNIQKISRSDHAMQIPKAISKANPFTKDLGGIDLNKIAIKRTGHVIKMQFDQAQLSALERGGFEGFTPVIINMTPISSPLSLLGINIAKEPEVLAKA